jgi:hypothetical protein
VKKQYFPPSTKNNIMTLIKIPCRLATAALLASVTININAATLLSDTFATASTVAEAGWLVSSATNKTIVADDAFPSGKALEYSSAAGYIWRAFSSPGTANDTTTISLTLKFRDLAGDDSAKCGFKIGLFNNAGTPASVTDDYGTFLIIQRGQMQILRDESSGSSGAFYGSTETPNIRGETITYSPYGTGLHTLSLTLSKEGDSFVVTALLDGKNKLSLSTTDPAFATVNEIIFSQRDGTADMTANFRISDVTVTSTSISIPEPKSAATALGLLMFMVLGLKKWFGASR